jgi:hypothetical protein
MVILMLILYGSLCAVSACVIGAACVVAQRASPPLPPHLAKGYPHSRPSTLHPHRSTKASLPPRRR